MHGGEASHARFHQRGLAPQKFRDVVQSAVEAVLEKHLVSEKDEGPVLAVEATGGETAELVLFTTRDIDRETVNRYIRESGLSGLHNIRTVIKLETIPTLGTGKTDYRALKKMLG